MPTPDWNSWRLCRKVPSLDRASASAVAQGVMLLRVRRLEQLRSIGVVAEGVVP